MTRRVLGQPRQDILLGPPSVDPDAAAKLRELIAKGASGFTVGFTTSDCQKLFEHLKAKKVEVSNRVRGFTVVTLYYKVDLMLPQLPAGRRNA